MTDYTNRVPSAATLTFREYSVKAHRTAVYKREHTTYPAMGLCAEAGEVAGVEARVMRDDMPGETARAKIKEELGDLIWFVNEVALRWNINLDELARANLEKLEGRMERGTIKGEGNGDGYH